MIETEGSSRIEETLRQFGVTDSTLSSAEKVSLDRDGYITFPNVVDTTWLLHLREAFEHATGQQQPAGKQTGTRHVDDLIWKDESFDGVFTHPRILAAVYHVLHRSFKVLQLSGRDPLPGYGLQGLHNDWMPRFSPADPFSVVTALWLLDDFTKNNGATRLIPESHLIAKPLPKQMQQPECRHPDQQIITAKAGAVLLFNGHLWHSGTRHEGGGTRRVLQCQYVARDSAMRIETEQKVPDRLTTAARQILGL